MKAIEPVDIAALFQAAVLFQGNVEVAGAVLVGFVEFMEERVAVRRFWKW